jgi:hypothetical protein
MPQYLVPNPAQGATSIYQTPTPALPAYMMSGIQNYFTNPGGTVGSILSGLLGSLTGGGGLSNLLQGTTLTGALTQLGGGNEQAGFNSQIGLPLSQLNGLDTGLLQNLGMANIAQAYGHAGDVAAATPGQSLATTPYNGVSAPIEAQLAQMALNQQNANLAPIYSGLSGYENVWGSVIPGLLSSSLSAALNPLSQATGGYINALLNPQTYQTPSGMGQGINAYSGGAGTSMGGGSGGGGGMSNANYGQQSGASTQGMFGPIGGAYPTPPANSQYLPGSGTWAPNSAGLQGTNPGQVIGDNLGA